MDLMLRSSNHPHWQINVLIIFLFVLVPAMSVMGDPSFAGWAAQRASGFGGNMTVVDKVSKIIIFTMKGMHFK